jgi:hypothetical protein
MFKEVLNDREFRLTFKYFTFSFILFLIIYIPPMLGLKGEVSLILFVIAITPFTVFGILFIIHFVKLVYSLKTLVTFRHLYTETEKRGWEEVVEKTNEDIEYYSMISDKIKEHSFYDYDNSSSVTKIFKKGENGSKLGACILTRSNFGRYATDYFGFFIHNERLDIPMLNESVYELKDSKYLYAISLDEHFNEGKPAKLFAAAFVALAVGGLCALAFDHTVLGDVFGGLGGLAYLYIKSFTLVFQKFSEVFKMEEYFSKGK